MKRIADLLISWLIMLLILFISGCGAPRGPRELTKTAMITYRQVRGVLDYGTFTVYKVEFLKDRILIRGRRFIYLEGKDIVYRLYSPSGKKLWTKKTGEEYGKTHRFVLTVDMPSKTESGLYIIAVEYIGRNNIYLDLENGLWLTETKFEYAE